MESTFPPFRVRLESSMVRSLAPLFCLALLACATADPRPTMMVVKAPVVAQANDDYESPYVEPKKELSEAARDIDDEIGAFEENLQTLSESIDLALNPDTLALARTDPESRAMIVSSIAELNRLFHANLDASKDIISHIRALPLGERSRALTDRLHRIIPFMQALVQKMNRAKRAYDLTSPLINRNIIPIKHA